MRATREELTRFEQLVRERGAEFYRDLPWRNTYDPYEILVSEVMLQQTQVSRVQGRWEEWLEAFPTAAALAAAPLPVVLELWQGMGYNRRALNLKRCAEAVVSEFDGRVPRDKKALLSLPGVGPSTSAGVRVFAFCEPDVYVETNVRAVFIHEFFSDRELVDDKDIIPLVEKTCPKDTTVRTWYYALLDYGAHLKKTQTNPTRKSRQYTRQSQFEGSHRQKRAYLLRRVLEGVSSTQELVDDLTQFEVSNKRDAPSTQEVEHILAELQKDGFVERVAGAWLCSE